jgi:hypothetical protein
MSGDTLPSNVDDPRFSSAEHQLNEDWSEPSSLPYWLVMLLESMLEALPRVVGDVLHP